MGPEKITDMPVATDCADGDLLTIVQGGDNKQIFRHLFLTAPAGGSTGLKGGSGGNAYLQTDGGICFVDCFDNGQMNIIANDLLFIGEAGTASFIQKLANGTWNWTFPSGLSANILDEFGNTGFIMDDASGTINLFCINGCTVSYAPGNPADWAGPGPPTTFGEAIDRIAAMLGPIT